MDNISRWSCTNEPGVSKYALVVPRGGGDNLTAYSIEQYDDDGTFAKHLKADIVATSLFAWSQSIPTIWSKPPTVQNFTVLSTSPYFVKPEFAKVADPYIVVESLSYRQGGIRHVIEHWGETIEASHDENGTLALGIYTDPADKNKLWALGAYESEDYFKNVHSKSAAVAELEEHTAGMRSARTQILLQKKGGFLYKGSEGCA